MSGYLELAGVGKTFGNVIALRDVSLDVPLGSVTCVLGDNGAGKSTLIKILSGVYQPDEGAYRIDGTEVRLSSPREAMDRGIATVFQDLAPQPLMPIWRAFFLGNEIARAGGRLDIRRQKQEVTAQLASMGINVRDVDQLVGTLSGGERQAVAIARAIYFGARILILDEPTSALGVKQAGVVLRYITAAKRSGVGVVFITHNPHHAYLVGDTFSLLNRGRLIASYERDSLVLDDLVREMAGGAELETLTHELRGMDDVRGMDE
ncbi:MAG: ATP-binding cassette domain-containing protein [Actinomycetales bacterium]|nr:ATP-binding cassette domain-containing protein [Actinomycetales bacterium]